jgi:hypothetical protein
MAIRHFLSMESEERAKSVSFWERCANGMVGILVHGNNHFILKGPRPTEEEAVELARYWSVVRICERKESTMGKWEIREKEFRENLEWAMVVPGDREASAGVTELLAEIAGRGIKIRRCRKGCW